MSLEATAHRARQVARYLEHDLSAVVLVCPWPLADFVVNGKPVLVVSTAEQALK